MLSKSWWKKHFDPVRKRSKWSLFYHMTCFKSGSYMSGSKYIFDPLVKSSFYGSLIYKTIFLLRYWSDAVEISRWSFPPMLEHIFFQLPPDFWSIQLFLFLVLPSAIEFLLPNLFDIFQLRSEPHFLLAILQSPTVIAYKQFSNWCCMAHVGIILRDSERFLRKNQSEIKLLFENRPYCNSFYFLIDGCCVYNPLCYLSIV